MKSLRWVVLLAGVGSLAQAAILVQFDFDNHTGTGPAFSEANDPAVLSAMLVRGTGLMPVDYISRVFASAGSNGADLAAAVAANDYFSIAITPAPGQSVTIESFSGLFFARNGGATYTLEAAASGFGSAPANNLGTQFTNADSFVPAPLTFQLASPLTISAAMEFRFYAYQSPGQFDEVGFGRATTADDAVDFAVNGVVVPEPATALLLIGALALLGGLRRRP